MPWRAFRWLVAMLVPVTLIGFGIRVLLTPLYLQLEYRLPSFPADEYGFTTEERIHWGAHGINFLLNDAPISFLGDLTFDTGKPLFGERELGHMDDVKAVVQRVLAIWYVVLVTMAGAFLWAWRTGKLLEVRRGLKLGGLLTLGIAAAAASIGAAGLMGGGEVFWRFFSAFHAVFFSGDSWLFAYSDTLIRLYPIRFWQDTVLYLGALVALAATALFIGLKDSSTASNSSR